MRKTLGFYLLLSATNAAAMLSQVDTVFIATNPGLVGRRACALGADATAPAEAKNVSLLFKVTDTVHSKAEVKADADIALLIDGQAVGSIDKGATSRVVAKKLADVAGKIATVATITDDRFVCSTALRGKPTEGAKPKDIAIDDRFMMVTGVEFSSADGFQSKQLRIPVTAAWNVEAAHTHIPRLPLSMLTFGHLDSTRRPIDVHLTLQALGEAGSIIRPQSFNACSRTRSTFVASADTLSTNEAIMGAGCHIRAVEKVGDNLFRLSSYGMVHDAVKTDTTVTTSLTWRLAGLSRLELELPNDYGILVGPAGMWAFETNPNGPSVRSLGRVNQYGLSIRQKDANGHQAFEFVALKGAIDVFPRDISTQFVNPLSSTDTATRVIVVPGQTQRVRGWSFRALFSPADGFFIRGYALWNAGYPDLATIAVLKTLDVSAALKVLGIKVD